MALATLDQISVAAFGFPLLDHVSCQIEAGQHIGLLGRNGSGKSTLLRILAGEVEPDGGGVMLAAGATVAYLPQEVPQGLSGSVREVILGGMPATLTPADAGQRASRMLSRMELDGEAPVAAMSAGMKRRVLLARVLAAEPDLVLLDEPTNHLDIDAIVWLQGFLERWSGTLVFVTHDRAFLRQVAGRILELDRGRIFDWSCTYDTFLARKEEALAAEEKQDAVFDKKLAQEEAWIRQGIKARRTRNEGRVRALERMRRERQDRRPQAGRAQLEIQQAARSGTLVAKLDAVSFAYGERVILRDFSTTILRGDRVGIIGANGSGKTTLLRLLLGDLQPQSGTVRLGTNLQIAYFDQLRAQLDEDASVKENVGEGADTVQVGDRVRHLAGYLSDFLFSAERARMPVKLLSGGERNRVLLARLFAKPANLLVLDEPTNDLDMETLELLEERLAQFDGTVLLVSHDREFLDNVVTSTIAFADGAAREVAGGYGDWLRIRPSPTPAEPLRPAPAPSRERKPRLKFKEQQELEALPAQIESWEAELAALHETMAQPAHYQQPGDVLAREQARLATLQSQLTAAYARWQDLEGRT